MPLRIEWLTVKKRRIMLKRILTVVLSVITHSSFSLPDVFCSFLYPFIDGTVSLRNIIIFTNFKAIYNMCHTGNTKLLFECLWLIVMFSVFFILSFQIFFLVDLGEGVCECMSVFFNLYIKERVTTFIIPSEWEVCQSMKIEQCFIGPIRFRSTI